MQDVLSTNLDIGGKSCRVWRKGSGPKLGFLAGFGGLPKWTPFLDQLSAHYEVVVPSLPGFPGGAPHRELDSHLDWVLAARDLLEACELTGHGLVASSVGAALAADVAALWPASVRRLALLAPFGLFDEREQTADPWARRADALPALLCASAERFMELRKAPTPCADPVEWQLEQTRAVEASARFLFPLGDTRLKTRLHRIQAPTLLLWGEKDRLLPPSYARRFAQSMRASTEVQIIPEAGHLLELDAPERAARAVMEWLK